MAARRAGELDVTSLLAHYERCFELHGATPRGVDWPNAPDLARRFEVIWDVMRGGGTGAEPVILDVGCGPGLFCEHLRTRRRIAPGQYWGVDLSEPMIDHARISHPEARFEVRDLIRDTPPADSVDYVVLCGVFTERQAMSHASMEEFAKDLLRVCYRTARIGVAFNCMSVHVDWTREDLFHWPLDVIASFCCAELSRHFVIRNDYGLYEQTVYVYKAPTPLLNLA